MANERHLEILRQGVPAWNRWRREHRSEGFDLRRAVLGESLLNHVDFRAGDLDEVDLEDAQAVSAELSGARLTGAALRNTVLRGSNLSRAILRDARLLAADLRQTDLRQADLRGADLGGADLEGADLRGARLDGACLWEAGLGAADLRRTSLQGADFGKARLDDADLGSANLEGANLWGARLCGARLHGTRLANADLADAVMGCTVLSDLDLHLARSLDLVTHLYPSNLGADTLRRSRGGIPAEFLRGVGLASGADPPPPSFITFDAEDRAFAARLHDDLEQRGIPCWLDEKGVHDPGGRLAEDLARRQIRGRILVCCSRACLAGEWLEPELRAVLEQEKREERDILIPLALDSLYLDGHGLDGHGLDGHGLDGHSLDDHGLDGWAADLSLELRRRPILDFSGWRTAQRRWESGLALVAESLRGN